MSNEGTLKDEGLQWLIAAAKQGHTEAKKVVDELKNNQKRGLKNP